MKRFSIYIILAILFTSVFIFVNNNQSSSEPQFGKDNPNGFASYMRYITGTPEGNSNKYGVNYRLKEYYRALSRNTFHKSAKADLQWVERGPGNVSGRTRALVVDPDDTTHNTWYAGSVSGGIWRTIDGGVNWENLTADIPVLSTSSLVMSKSDPDVMYAGTGEGFGGYGMVIGNGIFKSVERGNKFSWKPLLSTQFNKDFEYVNRVIVDYNSPDTVLACTNEGIFKSVDGGESWYNVYKLAGRKVQHIIADPNDFNVLYGAVNSWGIIKSTDKGETWFDINNGIGEAKRYELAVSPVNSNKLFASVEGYGAQTIVYYSFNQGESWHRFLEKDGASFNFLRSQGWFDNVITCHPYDEDIVYIGGVYLGKIEMGRTTEESEPQVLRVDTFATGDMIHFQSFGGRHFNGAMAIGSDEEGEDLDEDDWRSVEIRIGSKYKQKAHRFVVPKGSGAGVPADQYTYDNYIDVPFEVWDTDKNKQLMVSFRDNERDGEFNLVEFDTDEPSIGREYLFIHGVEYNENTPNEDITVDAGYTHKLLYFFWPALMADSVWVPDDLDGKIEVKYGKYIYQKGTATMLADDKKNKDLHVDHHQILALKTDEETKSFTLLNSNDGGIGISKNEGNTWRQITDGYNTTQFYGVAKKRGADEYIGGMQDNGTWQSMAGENASANTEYSDELEGDGFEALWHPDYPQRIIGSTYNNYFSVTNNGGEDWEYTYDGINGDGPFVSRLSHSLDEPNVIYAVGGRGVYKHYNFGLGRQSWVLTAIDGDFSVDNNAYSHDVEVSLANKNVVWAGTGMYKNPDLRIYVSKDAGFTFESTSVYQDKRLGFCTSIVTHPKGDSIAYVLFSNPEKPKILRTNNFGETWEDISGFGENDTSNNGFPDVVVYTLLVHPIDNDVLWAGTEIGLFESDDNGVSWHFADNGLPAVSIFQLNYIDQQIIAATHGRGIWTLDMSPLDIPSNSVRQALSCELFPNPVIENITLRINDNSAQNYSLRIVSLNGVVVHQQEVKIGETSINIGGLNSGHYLVQVSGVGKSYTQKIIKK